jgi:hypothetical protein
MSTVDVMINYLGMSVDGVDIDWTFQRQDPYTQLHYRMVRQVMELPPESLPQEVLSRYASISTSDFYNPIFPYTEKLLARFFYPLKSAKRVYCLGEFIACIEMCAHLGEMLAQLVWEMSAVSINEVPISNEQEKSLWGYKFEKLSQDRRIHVLRAFGLVSKEDEAYLDYLRVTRRKYFHLWSEDVANAGLDARECFLRITRLVKNTLRLEYENGSVNMNPLLSAYLAKHGLQ